MYSNFGRFKIANLACALHRVHIVPRADGPEVCATGSRLFGCQCECKMELTSPKTHEWLLSRFVSHRAGPHYSAFALAANSAASGTLGLRRHSPSLRAYFGR